MHPSAEDAENSVVPVQNAVPLLSTVYSYCLVSQIHGTLACIEVRLSMRFAGSLALSLLLAATVAAHAQDTVEHARDGWTAQHIQSIDIPPIANAPFSATVVTQSATIMPDGSRRTLSNHRLVARDSAGRVFQERRFFAPDGATADTRLQQIQIDDPNLHERILCNPEQKVCFVSRFDRPATLQPVIQTKLVRLANGVTIQNEDLGHSTVEDVDCLGSRQIRTFPAKIIGSDHPQPAISEFWYAPRLGINLVTKRFDPLVSVDQTFTVSRLAQAEPDPRTFAVPQGYKVIRRTE